MIRNNAIEKLVKQVKQKRMLKRAIALMSVVVILVTINTTKFKADTLQHYADCGFDYDHQHGPECYDAEGNLTCTLHVHTDACYQTRPTSVVSDIEDAESYNDLESSTEPVMEEAPVELAELPTEVVSEALEEAVEEVEVQLGEEVWGG